MAEPAGVVDGGHVPITVVVNCNLTPSPVILNNNNGVNVNDADRDNPYYGDRGSRDVSNAEPRNRGNRDVFNAEPRNGGNHFGWPIGWKVSADGRYIACAVDRQHLTPAKWDEACQVVSNIAAAIQHCTTEFCIRITPLRGMKRDGKGCIVVGLSRNAPMQATRSPNIRTITGPHLWVQGLDPQCQPLVLLRALEQLHHCLVAV
jgi:hypothetical protein